MNSETDQPTVPHGSRYRNVLTAICIVLAGGITGVVISVGVRALVEVQQQLASGAAPGLLTLVVKLVYTTLSLLAVSADAVRDGAGLGLGTGLLAAILYLVVAQRKRL